MAETTTQMVALKRSPHPAEWIVQGQRPQPRSIPKKPAMEAPKFSVKMTARQPAARPSVAP